MGSSSPTCSCSARPRHARQKWRNLSSSAEWRNSTARIFGGLVESNRSGGTVQPNLDHRTRTAQDRQLERISSAECDISRRHMHMCMCMHMCMHMCMCMHMYMYVTTLWICFPDDMTHFVRSPLDCATPVSRELVISPGPNMRKLCPA